MLYIHTTRRKKINLLGENSNNFPPYKHYKEDEHDLS